MSDKEYGGHFSFKDAARAAAPSGETDFLRGKDISMAEHSDFAPPLPEYGCGCGACVYLRRKQDEAYAARLKGDLDGG